MKPLAIEDGEDTRVLDYQPCLLPPRWPSHPSDTLSLILSTMPISPAPSPQSSRMPWTSLLCSPWPFPRPSPPPGFCPGLSLCREPLTCGSCSFPQGFHSPGGLTLPRMLVWRG